MSGGHLEISCEYRREDYRAGGMKIGTLYRRLDENSEIGKEVALSAAMPLPVLKTQSPAVLVAFGVPPPV